VVIREIVRDTVVVTQLVQQPAIGTPVVIPGVFFEFNQATLLPEAEALLEQVARWLLQNPQVRVEVRGHTDSVGTDEQNLRLSQQRAEAVRRYLIAQGVAPERIVAIGLGRREPIDTNDTPRGRARNRRVELIFRQ
jgi:OOP family OmpA-OmpF porin